MTLLGRGLDIAQAHLEACWAVKSSCTAYCTCWACAFFPHGSCATHVSSHEPSTWRLLRDFSVVSVIVNEGNGYETRKTSKGLTKSKHCCWVGPQPCTIFCFMLTHCAWLTRHKRFQWLIFQFTYAGVFLFYAGSRLKKLNKRIEHIDYYKLRAWYRFYSRVFNTMSRTSESSSEWVVWY